MASVVFALLVAGCGSGASEDPLAHLTTDPSPKAAAEWEPLMEAAGPRADMLLLPDGPPPRTVVVRELQKGAGRAIEKGDRFTVSYLSFFYRNGKPEEDRWGKVPFSWFYGVGQTVKGWEPGLRGMRVGGWRELIVPSAQAHGSGALIYLIRLRDAKEA